MVNVLVRPRARAQATRPLSTGMGYDGRDDSGRSANRVDHHGGSMACWVVKGKPSRNNLSEMLAPGKVQDWFTRKPPRAWCPGDRVLFWKSAPSLCLMGAGEIVAIRGLDGTGATTFTLRYLTNPLPTPISLQQLRGDAVVGEASFLKAGAAGTVFHLSDRQAERIATLVLQLNGTLHPGEAEAFVRLSRMPPRTAPATVRSGLVIREPYVSMILDGSKIWEIRGHATKTRGRIALIRAGSGKVVGTCDLVDVVGPLTAEQLRRNAGKAGLARPAIQDLPYPRTFAWVMQAPNPLRQPVQYDHPSGAVIWVSLSEDVVGKLGR